MQEKMKILGKVSLLTLIISALLLTGFRHLYPTMAKDAAPITLIIVVAMILSSLIEVIWQKMMKKGDGNDS